MRCEKYLSPNLGRCPFLVTDQTYSDLTKSTGLFSFKLNSVRSCCKVLFIIYADISYLIFVMCVYVCLLPHQRTILIPFEGSACMIGFNLLVLF